MEHSELELLISTWNPYFPSLLQSFLEGIMYGQYISYDFLPPMDYFTKFRLYG